MSVEIYADSTSDLPKKLAQEYSIHVIPLETRINGKPFLDGETIDTDTILQHMNAGVMPETAAPSPGIFQERFEKAHGNPIVSLHISSDLSATYKSALIAGEAIHPTPFVIDTRITSMSMGFLAMMAARKNADGMPAPEIAATVEREKHRAVAVFILQDLKWAAKGGRISPAMALAGKLANIKPIMMIYVGSVVEVQRIHTWGKAKSRLATLIQSMKFADLAIMYGANSTEVDEFISHVPVPTSKEILKAQMGAAILTHSGPVLIAACGILAPGSPPVTPAMLTAV
jgi:DegV family protein with EDD domain